MTEVHIPVKPYVKQFLISRYGPEHRVSRKTFLGLLLLELLNKKVEKLDMEYNPDSSYKLKISEFYFVVEGFNVDQDKLKFLGRCLERLFYDDFYNFVDDELKKGSANAYKSVQLYLQLRKITEKEMKLDSLYRKYQRYSSENIKSKKTLLPNV